MCRVTIFVCGREFLGSEDACRITSLKQPAVAAGHYEKGVSSNIVFSNQTQTKNGCGSKIYKSIDLSLQTLQVTQQARKGTWAYDCSSCGTEVQVQRNDLKAIFPQIGLRFPRSSVESTAEAIIDMKRYREEELRTVVDEVQWPLIIRLECMSEQGLQQGHSLSVSYMSQKALSTHCGLRAKHIQTDLLARCEVPIEQICGRQTKSCSSALHYYQTMWQEQGFWPSL